MHPDIRAYNARQLPVHRAICERLASEFDSHLPDAASKVWHAHPVWFLQDNPVAGYSLQKTGIRLMFWSGADFDEPALGVVGGKFKDASAFYNDASEIDVADLRRWIGKSRTIQWDYRNLVRRKGRLERLA